MGFCSGWRSGCGRRGRRGGGWVGFLFVVAEGDVCAGEEDAPVVVAGHGVRGRGGARVRAGGVVVPVVAACLAD